MVTGYNVKRAYLTHEDQDARRLKALMVVYDAALTACAQSDAERLYLAMDVLQSKLNFEVWPSLGLVLYAQYNRCRELGKSGRFIEAGRVLAELREAWTSGERREAALRGEAVDSARTGGVAPQFARADA
jgi:hypothetical protein